ncbi:MAG: hypothetical protein IT209_12425 [Armatimonadetes bacterium]|nr:hypothetical protein [Armatimonadota bacterium]
MKNHIRLVTLGLVLMASCGSLMAGELLSVPVAAVAQQGKTSKFKQYVKVDSRLSAQDRSVPLKMSLSMFQIQKYGYLKDGLIPVTTSLSFGQFNGNVGGKSVTQDLTSALKRARVPKMPSVTAFMTQEGDVRKVKISGLPNTKGPISMLIPKDDQIAAASAELMPPNGVLELGRSLRRDVNIPMPGARLSGQLSYTPFDVTEAGGEPVVKILVDGEGSVSADFAAIAESLAQGASLPVNVPAGSAGGEVHALVSGSILIGLNSGEMVRQDVKVTLFLNMNVMGQGVSGDMDITLGGYRAATWSQVASK